MPQGRSSVFRVPLVLVFINRIYHTFLCAEILKINSIFNGCVCVLSSRLSRFKILVNVS